MKANIVMRYLFHNKTIAAILFFSVCLVSCRSSKTNTSKTNELNTCAEIIVNALNSCQKKDDPKAAFDSTSMTLNLYEGNSIDDYEKKWEIPFKELDEKNTIVEVTLDYYSFQIYTLSDNEKIKYTPAVGESSFSNQHNFYLSDYCFDQKQRKEFIEAFKRAIILSKL